MERYSGVAWAVSEAEESGNIEWRMGWWRHGDCGTEAIEASDGDGGDGGDGGEREV